MLLSEAREKCSIPEQVDVDATSVVPAFSNTLCANLAKSRRVGTRKCLYSKVDSTKEYNKTLATSHFVMYSKACNKLNLFGQSLN